MCSSNKMGLPVRKAIIRAARYGMNIPELAIYFCMNKQHVTHSEYIAFCNWTKEKDSFYYWLRRRLNKTKEA